MKENRNWLVFANRNKCHHAEALHNLKFVNWKEGRTNMNIGDTVYLYMSDERRIRFRTQVVAEGCVREDGKYWQETPSRDLTYKLKLIAEYNGEALGDGMLRKHGFKGGRSIERPMYNNPTLFQYIESVFAQRDFTNLIDEVVPQMKSRELVKKIIPILIRWAKQGQTTNTYDDLIKELGYQRFSGIGLQLEYVDNVFKRFEELSGEKIPTLNALVKSKSTMLPSRGFSYVYKSYPNMAEEEKMHLVMLLNNDAFNYPYWDWVLATLGLTPSVDISVNEKLIRSGKFYGTGGEGENHKKLKKYIFDHPEMLGITDIQKKEMEYNLLSGDRLDVFFKLNDGSQIAVEIKPFTSPDADVTRGLFQCVKYKTILDAEDKVYGNKASNSAILVIGKELSSENKKIQEILGLTVKENVKI